MGSGGDMAHFHDGEQVKRAQWEGRWWSPARGIYCTAVSGHVDMECVQLLERGWMQTFERSGSSVVTFHDWSGVTGYETDARVQYTKWSEPIMKDVAMVHILLQSRIVAMGVSVANIVLGGKLKATSDRAAFERLRDAALRSVNA
ncbi:MAG: hypothetical protein AB2A00_32070 [Myxococcota bacterium]